MAPGDPSSVTEISKDGNATRTENRSFAFGSDDRYLQFREHYGLTLPILFNTWPWLSKSYVQDTIDRLQLGQQNPTEVKEYNDLRILFGDQSRFIMPQLLAIAQNQSAPLEDRQMAVRFFVRGGTRQAILGPNLPQEDKDYNRKTADDNLLLRIIIAEPMSTPEEMNIVADKMAKWFEANRAYYNFEPTTSEKISIFFFETRFFRYFSRVLTLDFGTLRNDSNKTVIREVTKRFKYSLTLSVIPMLITFVLCQIFGFLMAYNQNRLPDISLNVLFLILYAIPVFVVAPFLIEKVALGGYFPFTHTPIPTSGFTSPESIYKNMNTFQRLMDTLQHIALPIVAIMYGSLAASSRLSRTAVLEVLRHDYVRTAWAKGVPPFTIMTKHVGRNAAITIVTSLAGSLGVLLSGSLIVETLFDINGFGKFFYDAILNRDYNVIMFSAIAGSFLTLVGYLVADITYTLLDPRVTLE
jgi:peptide/nickel transport system permease protein